MSSNSSPLDLREQADKEVGDHLRPIEAKTTAPVGKEYTALEGKVKHLEALIQDLKNDLRNATSRSTESHLNETPISQNFKPESGVDKEKFNVATNKAEHEKENSTSTNRYRVVKRTWDTSMEMKEEDEDAVSEGPKNKIDYAFELQKDIFRDKEVMPQGTIEVYSHSLQKLMRDLLHHYPGHTYIGDSVSIDSPYKSLVANWDRLYEEAGKTDGDEADQQTRSDLKSVLELLSRGSGDSRLDQYLQIRESLKKNGIITFESLWTIFPPGTLVVGKSRFDQDQMYIVAGAYLTWPSRHHRGRSPWTMQCLVYDWDGEHFRRQETELSIEYFEGQRPIASLPFHPLDLDPNAEQIKEKLEQRGQKFREFCMATTKVEGKLHRYLGEAIFVKSEEVKRDEGNVHSNFNDDMEWRIRSHAEGNYQPKTTMEKEYVEGDVMVDFKSYHKYGPRLRAIGLSILDEDLPAHCVCSDCSGNSALQDMFKVKYDNANGKEKTWEPLQFMLCPPRVLGYVLNEKRWAELDLSCLQPVPENLGDKEWNERLRLTGKDNGKENKDLLKGLVTNHGMGEYSTGNPGYQVKDLVPKKGKGLVILLYGSPGVGKTSTAQTVAMVAKKPLLSVGVTDVGTNAEKAESNLKRIFELATTWKAILLIDEADVYLQSRTRGNAGPTTERNALVSVFLQILEYYQGILILTTNQIAQFDIAIQSRIHIAIKYPALNSEQTVAIFHDFLEQFENANGVESGAEIRKWGEKHLFKHEFDGRQIRNVVTSAMGLATSQKVKMKLEHVQQVVYITEAFKKDLDYQMKQWEEAQNPGRFRGF